jgi:hypothetical protein
MPYDSFNSNGDLMTKLTPAAQAVLDVANGAQSYGPDDCLNESRWVAAAALRAAADQLKYKLLDVEVVDCSQLRLLADELEAV